MVPTLIPSASSSAACLRQVSSLTIRAASLNEIHVGHLPTTLGGPGSFSSSVAIGYHPRAHKRRRGRLTFAGLWDDWHDRRSDERIKSCTMIITEPNEFVAELHDRMPVVLEPDQFEPWLTGKAGVEILKPAASDLLQRWPVSKRVNSSRAPDVDPSLIDPVEADQVPT